MAVLGYVNMASSRYKQCEKYCVQSRMKMILYGNYADIKHKDRSEHREIEHDMRQTAYHGHDRCTEDEKVRTLCSEENSFVCI